MELSAREIHNKQFHDQWRGYNQEEVDDFLDRVAEVLDRTERENAMMRQRVRELEQAVSSSREAEEMLKKTLLTAQQAAEEAIGKAKAKAEQLITEAEERAKEARRESEERVAAAEVDARRKTMDAERDFAQKKRDLDANLERLRAYETELKQRLRAFLHEQLRGLDTLTETPRTEQRPGQAGSAKAGSGRPVARPAGPQQQSTNQSAPDEVSLAEEEREMTPVEADPQRRGVRGFFSREG
jgi:cell division initiation protein